MFGPLDRPLAGVAVDLLDGNGQQVGSTLTDAQGKYKFENLAPWHVFGSRAPAKRLFSRWHDGWFSGWRSQRRCD